MKLTIRQPELDPRTCRVWLDDHEITEGLKAVDVSFDVMDVTSSTLSIVVDELDVDAETLAVLEAHVAQATAGGR